MATFLQLCQYVAADSGTISGESQPSTVVGQTGRLGKIVRWTNEAWRSIQNAHGEWRWMRSDFSGPTVSGTRSYAGSDWSLTRHAEWVHDHTGNENRFSIYLTATGVSDEGPLAFRDYDWFYANCMRGTQTNGRPVYFSVTPDNKLALHPIPDAVYTVRGPYRKTPQDLTANSDEPEMPARFHDLIRDVALMALGTYDEAIQQIPLWRMQKIERFNHLERDQLPRVNIPGGEAFA